MKHGPGLTPKLCLPLALTCIISPTSGGLNATRFLPDATALPRPPIDQSTRAVAETNASWQEVLALRNQAKELLHEVEQRTYEVAKGAANNTVHNYETKATEYFGSMVRRMRQARRTNQARAHLRERVAAQASKPILEARDQIEKMVSRQNKQVEDLALEAQRLMGKARLTAKAASAAEAQGRTLQAVERRAEAQALAANASEMGRRAMESRWLAESFNSYLPTYERAARLTAQRAVAKALRE